MYQYINHQIVDAKSLGTSALQHVKGADVTVLSLFCKTHVHLYDPVLTLDILLTQH